MLRVCLAGATGWTGRAIARGVLAVPDLELQSAVSRSAAGSDLGAALGQEPLGVPVHGDAAEALDGVDVLVDFTSVEAAKRHALAAIAAGVAVVIGTSGLTAADFEEIDAAARERSVGVIASGNFSLTAAACQAGPCRRHAISPSGRSSTTRARPSRTSRAARPASSPSGWPRCAGRRSAGRSKSCTDPRRRAARTSPACRSMPCVRPRG